MAVVIVCLAGVLARADSAKVTADSRSSHSSRLAWPELARQHRDGGRRHVDHWTQVFAAAAPTGRVGGEPQSEVYAAGAPTGRLEGEPQPEGAVTFATATAAEGSPKEIRTIEHRKRRGDGYLEGSPLFERQQHQKLLEAAANGEWEPSSPRFLEWVLFFVMGVIGIAAALAIGQQQDSKAAEQVLRYESARRRFQDGDDYQSSRGGSVSRGRGLEAAGVLGSDGVTLRPQVPSPARPQPGFAPTLSPRTSGIASEGHAGEPPGAATSKSGNFRTAGGKLPPSPGATAAEMQFSPAPIAPAPHPAPPPSAGLQPRPMSPTRAGTPLPVSPPPRQTPSLGRPSSGACSPWHAASSMASQPSGSPHQSSQQIGFPMASLPASSASNPTATLPPRGMPP